MGSAVVVNPGRAIYSFGIGLERLGTEQGCVEGSDARSWFSGEAEPRSDLDVVGNARSVRAADKWFADSRRNKRPAEEAGGNSYFGRRCFEMRS